MKLSSFLPDIRLYCPGMPEPYQYRFLVRALQEFFSRSEVWREWTLSAYDNLSTNAGEIIVPNAYYNPVGPVDSVPYVRTERVLKAKWVPTGEEIPRTTTSELSNCDSSWMETRGSIPEAWCPWPLGLAGIETIPVRLYPYPATVADETVGALKFFVVQTITEIDDPEEVYNLEVTLATSGVADWIFRRYRETIVAGTLARALMVPGVDWTNPQLAAANSIAFNDGVTRARSEAEAGQQTRVLTVDYGGY